MNNRPSFSLSYDQLLADLHTAYLDARKHKRNRPYQLRFEAHLEENLSSLCQSLWMRTYRPNPSTCFIIRDPKQREVFAADFRDRIVHHLYYNYVHEMLEKTFIHDSYSCIKGRGTHYGIGRLEQHIRKESQNYQEPCYVLKMDIRGYFMHIDRSRLLTIVQDSLQRMGNHRVNGHTSQRWSEKVDMDFVDYLTREIVLLNPTEDCRIRGNASDWDGLPASKSLFRSKEGCGLPIGNLTSQLFSNVYLNVLDQYMKRTLKCHRYGRYVDDFCVVSADREWLRSLVPKVRRFLQEVLGLDVHEGKSQIRDVRMGVEFLGAYLKPHRRYVSNATLCRMHRKLRLLHAVACKGVHGSVERKCLLALRIRSSLNSFLGVLSHYRSYGIRSRMMAVEYPCFGMYGSFSRNSLLFSPSSSFQVRFMDGFVTGKSLFGAKIECEEPAKVP